MLMFSEAQQVSIEDLADEIAILWRNHANERAYIQVLQCVLRDRMESEATLKMKTLRGTTARLIDPQYTGSPTQRRRARQRDAGRQCRVYWSSVA